MTFFHLTLWYQLIGNLEWSFSNIDHIWKNKACIISTQIFRIVIYLPKTFLATQSLFIVWNQKQMIYILVKTGSGKRNWLTSKDLAKILPLRTQSLFIVWNQKQMIYILVKTGSGKRNWLTSKDLAKILPLRTQSLFIVWNKKNAFRLRKNRIQREEVA